MDSSFTLLLLSSNRIPSAFWYLDKPTTSFVGSLNLHSSSKTKTGSPEGFTKYWPSCSPWRRYSITSDGDRPRRFVPTRVARPRGASGVASAFRRPDRPKNTSGGAKARRRRLRTTPPEEPPLPLTTPMILILGFVPLPLACWSGCRFLNSSLIYMMAGLGLWRTMVLGTGRGQARYAGG